MAWPKGRKLSASHKAAISRSLKGRSRLGRPANRRTGQASRAIVKRVLRNKDFQAVALGTAGVLAGNALIGSAVRGGALGGRRMARPGATLRSAHRTKGWGLSGMSI